MKLSRKLISMLLIAMFLVTSITATDVITPSLTSPESNNLMPRNTYDHCYFSVDNVPGYWVERWYSNTLADAYFVPTSQGRSMIAGANLSATNSSGISHTHVGSLSTCNNIAPMGNRTRCDSLPGYINACWDYAIQVIDNPLPEVSVMAYPYEYYYYTNNTTATYYGDLICDN